MKRLLFRVAGAIIFIAGIAGHCYLLIIAENTSEILESLSMIAPMSFGIYLMLMPDYSKNTDVDINNK